MRYRKLGRTGLDVSAITLGCMSWGDGGQTRPWTKDEAFAERVIQAALDAGIKPCFRLLGFSRSNYLTPQALDKKPLPADRMQKGHPWRERAPDRGAR